MTMRTFPILPIVACCMMLPVQTSTPQHRLRDAHPKTDDATVLVVNTELDVTNQSNVTSLVRQLRRVLPTTWRIDTVHFLAAAARGTTGVHRVVLTGQGTPWTMYTPAMFASFKQFLDAATVPVLGICGGHQLIALAAGGRVAPIRGKLRGTSYKGMFRQKGFTPVRLTRTSPLFAHLDSVVVVWENHVEEVKAIPAGYVQTASEHVSGRQAFEHRSRPIFGVQFHPERWDEAHPAGRTILRNFFGLH